MLIILIFYLWKVTIMIIYKNHWTLFHHFIHLLSLIMYAKKIRALLENCTFFFLFSCRKSIVHTVLHPMSPSVKRLPRPHFFCQMASSSQVEFFNI